jgi:hypothetical protein
MEDDGRLFEWNLKLNQRLELTIWSKLIIDIQASFDIHQITGETPCTGKLQKTSENTV